MPIVSVRSAAHRPISGPGLFVLAFLVRNVFVVAVVPKVAAGCSPEVALISVHWATPSWSEDEKKDKGNQTTVLTRDQRASEFVFSVVLTRQWALSAV